MTRYLAQIHYIGNGNNVYHNYDLHVSIDDAPLLKEEFRKYQKWIYKLNKGDIPACSVNDSIYIYRRDMNVRYMAKHRYPRIEGFPPSFAASAPLNLDINLYPFSKVNNPDVIFEKNPGYLIDFLEQPLGKNFQYHSIGYRVLPVTYKVLKENFPMEIALLEQRLWELQNPGIQPVTVAPTRI